MPALDETVLEAIGGILSAELEQMRSTVLREVKSELREMLEALPVPRDGRDGRDGIDGRDAGQLEVLDAIEAHRSYARGTYAHHAGGLVRATRRTEPLDDTRDFLAAGWQVVVRGIEAVECSQPAARESLVKIAFTDGAAVAHALAWPVPLYRGIYNAETDYAPADTCTYDGAQWYCNAPTRARPGASDDWTLCVRRGRDGKAGGKP